VLYSGASEIESQSMAMPRRDGTIEEIKRLEPLLRGCGGSSALLEYAVMHEDEAEAARIRAELKCLVEKV